MGVLIFICVVSNVAFSTGKSTNILSFSPKHNHLKFTQSLHQPSETEFWYSLSVPASSISLTTLRSRARCKQCSHTVTHFLNSITVSRLTGFMLPEPSKKTQCWCDLRHRFSASVNIHHSITVSMIRNRPTAQAPPTRVPKVQLPARTSAAQTFPGTFLVLLIELFNTFLVFIVLVNSYPFLFS